MAEAAEGFLALEAPESLTEIHTPVTRLARVTLEATDLYEASFTDFGAGRLEAGGVKFSAAHDRVDRMTESLADFNEALSKVCDLPE